MYNYQLIFFFYYHLLLCWSITRKRSKKIMYCLAHLQNQTQCCEFYLRQLSRPTLSIHFLILITFFPVFSVASFPSVVNDSGNWGRFYFLCWLFYSLLRLQCQTFFLCVLSKVPYSISVRFFGFMFILLLADILYHIYTTVNGKDL